MYLAHLRLRDFRNFARLDEELTPGFHLFTGDNGQGKTNLIEAIYLIATLRSFHGVGGLPMIRQGQKGYFIGGRIVGRSHHEVKIYWSLREQKLSLDGQPVRKLTDYIGVLRAVAFCAEDIQLVKGAARVRRRFLDLLLTQTHRAYLSLLQRYAKSVRSRNTMLRQPADDQGVLESFSRELVQLGQEIIRLRRELVPKLAALTQLAYRRIANDAEDLQLDYQPSVKSDFALELAQSRRRESVYRFTLIGPHRDDMQLTLNGRSAAQYGSEGQKRTFAIALKMAQAEYVSEIHGSPPVLLIDDVMGELDPKRRAGFLPLLERTRRGNGQVFMTTTDVNMPTELGNELQRWLVKSGELQKCH